MSSSDAYDSDTASDERPSSATQPRTKIHAHFQICRPPPKSTLRLSSKLLLQIQQLPQNHRPVPVLEIWQPPFRKSKLTRDFPQRPKLRSGDIYASTNEPYIINQAPARKDSTRSDEESDGCDARNKDIVAALCHGEDQANIYFRDARCSWQASSGVVKADSAKTCYRFVLKDSQGSEGLSERMLLQCEKRDSEKVDVEDEFILFLIDRTARRKSRIATMTAGGLEILVRKSSILESLEACMGLCAPVGTDSLESWLYTQVLTVGVWVAQREGWHGLA